MIAVRITFKSRMLHVPAGLFAGTLFLAACHSTPHPGTKQQLFPKMRSADPIQVEAPAVAVTEETSPDTLRFYVRMKPNELSILFRNKVISLKSAQQLDDYIQTHAIQTTSSGSCLEVSKAVSYADVAKVIAIFRKNKINNLQFVTRE